MKKYRYFIIPIVCVVVFIMSFNSIITKVYNEAKLEKNLTQLKHSYNHIVKDRGGVLKEAMFEDDDLILLGSSELKTDVDQNPRNMFPFKGANYDVSIFGRANTQSLQHASILGTTENIKEDSKIALVVSLQWFEKLNGIGEENFVSNFSEYQFYKILESDDIGEENKKYYAKRISELLKDSSEYGEVEIYASLYSRDSIPSKLMLTMLKPYYKFKTYMLDIKDKVQSYKAIKILPDKTVANEEKIIEWDAEYTKAESQGKEKVTNNDLYVDDEYYNKYLQPRYDELMGSSSNVDLMSSKEFKDYELFLDISEDLGAKPLIILMPVNGLYYDHLGITKDKREEFYSKVQELAEARGFTVLNLEDKEYEKYYLTDVMHLGWKGWLNVNEKISEYFSER